MAAGNTGILAYGMGKTLREWGVFVALGLSLACATSSTRSKTPAAQAPSESATTGQPTTKAPPAGTSRRPQSDPCAEAVSPNEKMISAARRRLYETVCDAALWFDGLFGEGRRIAVAQRTSGHVELSGLNSDVEGTKVRTRFNARIDLPNLEKKLHAFIGRESNEEFIRDRYEGLALHSQFLDLEGRDDWVAGFGYSLADTYQQRTDFNVGANGGFSPKVFVQGRYRRNFVYGDRDVWHFRETVFWTNRDGFGSTTTMDFDRVLSPLLLLRWGNVGTVSEASHGLDWRSAIVLFQNLRGQRALGYEVFVRGETAADVPVREYGARSIYRQSLFGNRWLFGEVVLGYGWIRLERRLPREGSTTVGIGVDLWFGRGL
jgi:hypothetical protein